MQQPETDAKHGSPEAQAQTLRDRLRLGGPGLRVFVAIADRWHLTEHQRRAVLGSPLSSSYDAWTESAQHHRATALEADVLMRISAVLGIHCALETLFASGTDGRNWLTAPHGAKVFGGKAPLDLMTSGNERDLLAVLQFLNAACTGLYMEPNEVDRGFEPYTIVELDDSQDPT
jgi:hypothetical protein